MKLKVLAVAAFVVVALFFLNRRLNESPTYISGVPSAATPGSGSVRTQFRVGFLPVT
jgi:hypothetical protein